MNQGRPAAGTAPSPGPGKKRRAARSTTLVVRVFQVVPVRSQTGRPPEPLLERFLHLRLRLAHRPADVLRHIAAVDDRRHGHAHAPGALGGNARRKKGAGGPARRDRGRPAEADHGGTLEGAPPAGKDELAVLATHLDLALRRKRVLDLEEVAKVGVQLHLELDLDPVRAVVQHLDVLVHAVAERTLPDDRQLGALVHGCERRQEEADGVVGGLLRGERAQRPAVQA